MKIIDARVDWFEEYDNAPSLRVLFDKEPDYKTLRYQKKGCLYLAQQGPFVNFFYYTRPGEGYGGRVFSIVLEDDTPVDLVGPWSSNSSCLNQAGFTPCREIAYASDLETWKRGFTFCSGAITIDAWKEAIDTFCPDAHYTPIKSGVPFSAELSNEQASVVGFVGNESIIEWGIARKGMSFNQSQAFKRAKRSLKTIKEWSDKPYSWVHSSDEWEKLRLSHIEVYNKLVTDNNLHLFGLEIIK
jgi:hypothetical protein